jgi:hypothetical protein
MAGAAGWAALWAGTWEAAWPRRDDEAIVALQAVDGRHWSSPLRAPHRGMDFDQDGLVARSRD